VDGRGGGCGKSAQCGIEKVQAVGGFGGFDGVGQGEEFWGEWAQAVLEGEGDALAGVASEAWPFGGFGEGLEAGASGVEFRGEFVGAQAGGVGDEGVGCVGGTVVRFEHLGGEGEGCFEVVNGQADDGILPERGGVGVGGMEAVEGGFAEESGS
jgi:hypothetical protein